MELKDRKFINNTGNLPGFAGGTIPPVTASEIKPNMWAQTNPSATISGLQKQVTRSQAYGTPLIKNIPATGSKGPTQADSSATGIHPGFAIGAWLGGGVLEGINRIKSADEHLADAGTSEANINGIAYTQQNTVDAGQIMSEYDKTTAKDFLTNPGRGLASLFGRSKAKREAENAAIHADIMQGAARDNAYTRYLRLDNAKRYGNTNDQQMYAAKDGKLPKYKEGLVSGETNAKVSNGEFIAREVIPGQFVGYRVPGPKNNKDGRLAHLEPEDYVISNKNGSSDIAASGDIIGAINHMLATGNPSYKCGKLPRFEEGWVGNFIPAILGTTAGLEQMLSAYRNKPYKPNSYASNPYETEGLTTLAGLRVNPYPIMNQLRSAEARTNRAVDIAGGLSGGQRTAARLAALNTTQNNISNLLSNIQTQNNAYKSAYAQAAINAGQQSRAARMSANQWDYDMYAKAHAARNRGIQTGIANMLSQIQQYQANEFKRRQFNDTMALYRDDMDQRKKHMNWMQNHSGLNISQNADPIKNPSSQYWNQLLPSEKWLALYNRGIIG